MKKISIRELHRSTGRWVRSARRYGEIVVSDRNKPVAKLLPVDDEAATPTTVNPFRTWKPLKKYAKILERPVRGTPVEDMISEDRER